VSAKTSRQISPFRTALLAAAKRGATAHSGGYRVPYSRHAVTLRSSQAEGKPAYFDGLAEVTRQIAGCFPGLILLPPSH
jgi:hypothetical protein